MRACVPARGDDAFIAVSASMRRTID
jgi:hypothetical protein